MNRLSLILVGLWVTGCSSGIAGQARALPYVPVDPESVVLQPITSELSETVLALSPDGQTVIVESDEFGICAVPVQATEIGASDSCAGTEESDPTDIAAVEFNAAGTKAVMRQDFVRTFRGGAWIFDVATGRATALQLSGGPIDEGEGFLAVAWNLQRDEIYGISYERVEDGPPVQQVVRVDSETSSAEALGEPFSEEEGATGQVETAADSLLYLAFQAGEPAAKLISVDLKTGDRTSLDIGTTGDNEVVQNYLLGISPDGQRALFQQLDNAFFVINGVLELDLGSGTTELWPGSEGLAVTAAAYSPDGAQVLLVGRHQDSDQDYSLLLYSSAGDELKDLGAVEESVGPQSRLSWGTRNVISLELPSGVVQGDPIGWLLAR